MFVNLIVFSLDVSVFELTLPELSRNNVFLWKNLDAYSHINEAYMTNQLQKEIQNLRTSSQVEENKLTKISNSIFGDNARFVPYF